MIKMLLLALGRRLTFLLYTAVGDKFFSLPVTPRRKFYNRNNEQEKTKIPFHFFSVRLRHFNKWQPVQIYIL